MYLIFFKPIAAFLGKFIRKTYFIQYAEKLKFSTIKKPSSHNLHNYHKFKLFNPNSIKYKAINQKFP